MDSDITLVITSCHRHALLKMTLDSFIRCVDLPVDATIITEDSFEPRPDWLLEDYSPKLGKITWLQDNESKKDPSIFMRHIDSIDRAYAKVQTTYIFHCEDDWLFIRKDFMIKSKNILSQYPQISMVAIRGMRLIQDACYPFPLFNSHIHDGWGGMHFNPGLRRLSDYLKIGGHYRPHCTSGFPERDISQLYLKMGYVMADVGYECIEHLGDRCHVGRILQERIKPGACLPVLPVSPFSVRPILQRQKPKED